MSGGEQQLAVIARVLTQEPHIILLDEPTNHLDYGNQHRILASIRKLAEKGYIIISTSHNPDHALELGGNAAVLDSEGCLKTGEADEILTAEMLSSLYHLPMRIEYVEAAGRKICFSCGENTMKQFSAGGKS